MNTINPGAGAGGSSFTLPQGTDAGAAVTAATVSTVAQQEILSKLMDAVAGTVATQSKQGGDGVTDARGAPALSPPGNSFSANDMVDLLRSIRGKSQEGQLQAAKSQVEAARVKAEKNNEAQLEKINDWIKKSEEAANKGTLGKIFGWIGKIAAVIASVVAVAVAAAATVASGGAAAPLLALAVMGMVGATISLADQISKECGGPEISLSNLVTTAVGKFLEACGVPEETANKIGKVMAGVAAIAMPAMLLIEPNMLGTMATGICELAGASKDVTMYVGMAVGMVAAITVGIVTAVASGGAGAGTAVANVTNAGATVTANTASTAAKIANGAVGASAQIVGGVTQIGTGVVSIEKAHIERDAENLLADKKGLDAAMIKLQQQMEEGREEMKKVIQQIEEGLQTVTQMINGAADSMSQITANLGKRMAV